MPKISDEQRAASRQRLIDATLAVAERDGAEGLTTRAIVAEAGVSAGMFYGHFDSKEALLAAVVDTEVEELTTIVLAEIELGTEMVDVLKTMLRELVVVADLRPLAAFRAVSDTEVGREAQREINRRIVDAFTPMLQSAIHAGIARPEVDIEAIVEIIDIAIDGINRRRSADGFVTTDDRVASSVLAMIENFLLVPPGELP